jgi:glycosyltransferase involved in cell wall biosynthesis
MTELSVVIPVYNKAQFLPKCLDSILKQSLGNMQIICVNDGSTDDSLDILSKYAANDDRILVHSQSNSGVSLARNAGMQLASSPYITFMDPDDYLIDSSAYENMLNIAKEDGSDMVFTYFYDTNEYGEIVDDRFSDFPTGKAITLQEKASFIRFAYPWQKVYRLDLFKDSLSYFPPGLIYEDNPLNLRVVIKSNQISVYPKRTVMYVHNHFSITKQKNLDAFNMFDVVALMEQEIKDNRIIDRSFVEQFIDYKLELLAWGYLSLPSSYRHKIRYLRQWEQTLTLRDRKRLRSCPRRKFEEFYKYIATDNTNLYILKQMCRKLPRLVSYALRLLYSLINLPKVYDQASR